jgi:ribonuclease P protein subunit RPR2
MNKKRRPNRKPAYQQRIARERIEILFNLAEKKFGKHPELSNRYVELARKIGMRYNITLPKGLKRTFCRKCRSYIVPGKNCIVRTSSAQKSVIVKCLECGNVMRFPYRRERNLRRKRNNRLKNLKC